MKKLLSLFLTFCMLLSAVSVMAVHVTATDVALTPDTKWCDEHTADADLYIETAAELLGFSKLLATQLPANNAGTDLDTADPSTKLFVGKTIHIMADIDLNPGWDAASGTAPTNVWLAGNYKCFTGMIDGHGHTISGIYLKTTGNHTGIFGNTKGGTQENPVGVKNLAIVNSYLTSKANNFGGLFGAIPQSEANKGRYVLIENVYTDITMVTTYATGKNDAQIGGIIGYVCPGNTLTIRNTVVNGAVKTTSNDVHLRPMGGFAGLISGSTAIIEDCLFTGTVRSGQNQVAAFVGMTNSAGKATINRCMEVGDIYPATYTSDFNGHGSICGILNGTGSSISNCIYTDVYKGTGSGFTLDHNLYGAPNSSDKLVEGTTNVNNTYIPDSEVGTKLTGLAAVEQLEKAQMTATWTPTTIGLPLPRGIVETFGEKVLTKANTAGTSVVKLAGYQTTAAVDEKFDLRLVATLKLPQGETVGSYKNVGFCVVANCGNTSKTKNYATDTVYNSVEGYTNGGTTVETYTAASLGGDYLFVLPCRNVPTNAGEITMEITVYYTTADGNVVYGATQMISIQNQTALPNAD